MEKATRYGLGERAAGWVDRYSGTTLEELDSLPAVVDELRRYLIACDVAADRESDPFSARKTMEADLNEAIDKLRAAEAKAWLLAALTNYIKKERHDGTDNGS